MCDYAILPIKYLPVMDKILGYLSVKEKENCKHVWPTWKVEIERREQKNDTLVLHSDPYPWNMHWSETNNGGLMKFENSFQIRAPSFLEHPLNELLQKIKKLALVNLFRNETNLTQACLDCFRNCEEIEIRSSVVQEALTFDMPKLRVLVLKDSSTISVQLTLNCPSLEVLFWNQQVDGILFQSPKKLKRLVCFGWPASFSLSEQSFESLSYLNLFAGRDEHVNDRLLERMPNLKRFVLYSSDPQADLESIRQQQKLYGLADLEVLFSGFRDPVRITRHGVEAGFVKIDEYVEQLFENYSKLVDDSPWGVYIDYSKLFGKFKILPSNFFKRFSQSYYSIEIREVTNYTHLFAFLKCYPFIRKLCIHWSKVEANRVMDLMYSLQPSLTELAIREEHSLDLLQIDLSFISLFNRLAALKLHSTHFPIQFIRKVAARRGPHFDWIMFDSTTARQGIAIKFASDGVLLIDIIGRSRTPNFFPSIEQLISAVQSDAHLGAFFL